MNINLEALQGAVIAHEGLMRQYGHTGTEVCLVRAEGEAGSAGAYEVWVKADDQWAYVDVEGQVVYADCPTGHDQA